MPNPQRLTRQGKSKAQQNEDVCAAGEEKESSKRPRDTETIVFN